MRWRPSYCLSILLLLCCSRTAVAAECAAPGNDGATATTGIVNTYWAGLGNPNAGTTSFSLGSARGASQPIAPGDLVLIIQMQDATINSANSANYGDGGGGAVGSGYTALRSAGRYEFARATNSVSLAGGTLTIASGALFNYEARAATGGAGQRSYQIIRVPQYVDLTLTGTITAPAWNGATGGVAVLDVADTLTLGAGGIDVTGLGFRGGGARFSTTGSGSNTDYRTPFSNAANGSKGEGIAGTPRLVFSNGSVTDNTVEGYPNGSFARGAPGNAGGGGTDGQPSNNDQNTGGGGGGGYGGGGNGGHAWCPGGPAVCPQTGGFGGSGVNAMSASLLTLGGGGGAGTTNNATGTPGGGVATSGANGGGVIILRAGNIVGTGTLRADGAPANQTVGNDGSGGGGAGGAILISADDTTSASLNLSARGGLGGSNNNSTPHGPGGGGGGGFVARTVNLLGATIDVSAGAPGDTDGNPAPFTANYGATSGSAGIATTITALSIPGLSSGFECSVLIDKSFVPALVSENTPSRLTLNLSNPNPTLPLTALSLTDSYPANLENASIVNLSNGCGGTVTAPGGSTAVTLSGITVAAASSCEVALDVVATASGDLVNQIPVGDVAAQIGGQTVQNLNPTEDTLTAFEPLEITKTVAIISDPINGSSDPLAVPGAIAEYTILISNSSGVTIDNDAVRLTDLVPEDTVFLNVAIEAGLPVALVNGVPSSALTLNAGSLSYSDDDGATYAYGPPSPGPDANIDAIRISPVGALAPGSSASIRFRVLID